MCPALESGLLRASASMQEPDVRLSFNADDLPVVTIEEGAAVIEIELLDLDGLRRFQRRVAALGTRNGGG